MQQSKNATKQAKNARLKELKGVQLDEDAFAVGQAEDSSYTLDKLWTYSKSGPKKDKYQSLIKVASCDIVKNEKTGEILSFNCVPVEWCKKARRNRRAFYS